MGLDSKADDLRTEDERVFCTAKILTDLRPVFGSHVEDGPHGMIVVHLLKIGYHSGSEKLHEFFVSLDSGDSENVEKFD